MNAMHLNEVVLFPEKYPTGGKYPFNLDLFRQTKRLAFTTPITFFIGENGTGKSTLLEAIANKCSIHIWRGIERTRVEVNPYEKELYRYISVEWENGTVPGSFFASNIFQNFVQNLDVWASSDPGLLDYFGGRSLMTQSHGQSLMSFFETRFKIKGLYLLDEPETALSPKSQINLLKLLYETSRSGDAQFIVATHSPILLACPGSIIYSFDHIPVKRIEYEETDYFKVYKSFLEDREKYAGFNSNDHSG